MPDIRFVSDRVRGAVDLRWLTRLVSALGVLIAGLAAIPAAAAQERCEPAACVASISSRVAVTAMEPTASQLTGHWERTDLLSGENLYLFPDGSFVCTEWSEFLAPVIYDKGMWRIEAGVLRLSPDADVTWDLVGDRRFAALRVVPAVGLEPSLLFGLDRSLDRFLERPREQIGTPGEQLQYVGFWHVADIGALEADGLKKKLLARSWRPGLYKKPDDIAVSRRRLRELLDVIRNADRVDAIQLSFDGMGMTSEFRADEKPVRLDPETGRQLARILTRFDWEEDSAHACMFIPHVAFRFHRGGQSARLLVGFGCREMALDGVDWPIGGLKDLGDAERTWLRAARRAFPRDLFLQQEK